ncbi:LAMI_0H02850g1_1 [Lachancea mirantina]|uniref:LAMI_0H02850g1_1 n=1 Tax=Lachancea mirantina TaxID=1230905 RepID=A0A1G4KE74_9SACH|nr:LAMI_0H02850g1_1 [Lachancea mirantina]
MDEVKTHQQLRPYYDADSFNAGYSSVFKPDQGVIDSHGLSIADKLKTMTQSKAALGNKSTRKVALSQLTSGLRSKIREAEVSSEESNKALHDMEWSDFVNWKSWKNVTMQLLDQFVRKYLRHLVQQPFEAARLLMQVGDFDQKVDQEKRRILLEVEDNSPAGDEGKSDAEDDEDIDFFPETDPPQLTGEDTTSLKHMNSSTHHKFTLTKRIQPKTLHTMDVLNSVMDEEGTRGLWRANNTTFIYNFLSVTLDAWFTGLMSPLLQIPDPYFIDILHSTDAKKSIILSVAASVFTGLALLPIDIIRTRLTVTSSKLGERSFRNLVRKWSWKRHFLAMPIDLILLSTGYSSITTLFHKMTGVILYNQFSIDKYSQAMWYNTFEFISRIIELFVKLPVETLLKRSQVSYLLKQGPQGPFPMSEDYMIVEPRAYRGVYTSLTEKGRLHELWRGWRLGLLSVMCSYGLKLMDQDVMEEERF